MVEDRNSKLAKEHYEKAEDYTKQAGQHTASAASTVGHDLRAAGEQLAEAGKSIGSRCSPTPTWHRYQRVPSGLGAHSVLVVASCHTTIALIGQGRSIVLVFGVLEAHFKEGLANAG